MLPRDIACDILRYITRKIYAAGYPASIFTLNLSANFEYFCTHIHIDTCVLLIIGSSDLDANL